MFTYKAEIKSGPLLEVKYYKSFRKRNKKNLARQINQSRTNEKQTKANRIRGEQHTQRLILCNFSEGDWFARFPLRLVNLPKMNLRGLSQIFLNE